MEALAFEQVTIARVANGQDGKNGANGYTPVKGVDYFDGQDGTDGRSIVSTIRYYILAETAPETPSTEWDMIEPLYDLTIESTQHVYFADHVIFSDDTDWWSQVSMSSSYEAAKTAYLEAVEAAKTATNYIGINSNGLVVGDMTGDTLGNHVLIDSDSVDIRNGEDVLASYGSDTVLYSDGVDTFSIKNGTGALAEAVEALMSNCQNYTHGVSPTRNIGVIFRERSESELPPMGGSIYYDSTTNINLLAGDLFIFHAIVTEKWGWSETSDYYILCSPTINGRLDSLSWSLFNGNVIYINDVEYPCSCVSPAASREMEIKGTAQINNSSYICDINGSAPLLIGTKEGTKLLADSTQIMAQNKDGDPATLTINGNGGDVEIGGNTNINGNIAAIGTLTTDSNIYAGGHIILKNGCELIGRNAEGLGYNLVYVNVSDNIVWGSSSLGGHYFNMLPNKQFRVRTGETNIINSWYDATDGRYTAIPAAYAQTTSGGSTVRVGSTGILYRYVSSSRRYKEAITTQLGEELNPERLYDLLVVQYKYREGHLSKTDQRYGKEFIGLLAEDVKMKYPIAANMGEDGFVENYNIDILVPAMLKLIQSQKKQLGGQEMRIKALEERLKKLEDLLNSKQ